MGVKDEEVVVACLKAEYYPIARLVELRIG
jgi:hypothetical protein